MFTDRQHGVETRTPMESLISCVRSLLVLFLSPKAVFLEQMYRAIVGDRHYHSHTSQNENAQLSTLSDLILDNSLVSSIPLDTFTAIDTGVSPTSSSTDFKEAVLADG